MQQRLPHTHVVQRRQPGVHAGEHHADPRRLVHGKLRVLAQRRQLRGRGEQHHVGVARLQRDHPRALLGHHLEDDAVDERLVAPVVGIALDDHVRVGLPLDELERASADGRPAEVGAHLLHGGRRHDAHAVHRERAEDRPVGLLRDHVDGEVVDDLGAAQRARQARPARGRLAVERAVEREAHRLGIERRAVVELHVRAQLESHARGRHDLVRGRERGLDLHLLVEREQTLEHVEVDPGAGRRRLEIRIE